MEPERAPSSLSRSSLWPLALLGILLFAFRSSKRNQSRKAIHPQDTTGNKDNAIPERTTPVTLIPNPSPTNAENPNQCRYPSAPWWKDGIEIAAVLIALGLLIANVCQSRSTEKAAQAAQTASETAKKQLELSERPWLKVWFSVQPPGITFQNGGMQLNITPHIENIGHSVATSVISPMKIFLADDADTTFNQPLKRQKEFCDNLAKQPIHPPGSMEVVIFPNDSDSTVGYGLGLSKAEIDAAKDERIGVAGANLTGPKLLVPIVYGCVDYMYDTSERHHQTQFILELQQTNRTITIPNSIPMIAIRAGQSVDASNVVITKYPFGGFYAY